MNSSVIAWSGRLFILVLLAAAVAWYVYGLDGDVLTATKAFFLAPDSNVALFLLSLLILPLLGLPITAFCLMAGAKFGITGGLVAIGAAMLLQQLICFWLMHSYFRQRLKRLVDRRGYSVPAINRSQQITWGVSLVAVPVLPYMVKNVLLAAGQLSLWQYLLVAWPIQMLFSVPFVAITGAARQQDTIMIWLAAAGFIVLWLIFRWLQSRRKAGLVAGESQVEPDQREIGQSDRSERGA